MGMHDPGPPRKPSPVEHLPPTSFPSMFSQPPPSTAPSMPTNPGKTARQEQLIKKLVGMLPGSDEDTIKNCITALRVRHGKLSGIVGRDLVILPHAVARHPPQVSMLDTLPSIYAHIFKLNTNLVGKA